MKPISTRWNSLLTNGTKFQPMKSTAQRIQRKAARLTWPWATQAWLTVTEER